MEVEIKLPVGGIFKGTVPGAEPDRKSPLMSNVRPVDVNVKRIRLGQRPALGKWSGTQIGGFENPVVSICVVSSVL